MTDSEASSSKSSTGESRIVAFRYRLDERIADGAFIQMWRGYDLELQRVVAVKIPKPDQPDSAEAFMAAARVVVRLKHPGIVPVYDVGYEGGTCFSVSEFVEGGSLGDYVGRQPISTPQVIRWITDVAEALEYAHKNGVVHRDIKPSNILIGPHGRALLSDFGVAQSLNESDKVATSIGTFKYMSPEQLEGKEADVRSDIYSLGVVLHELLTSKLPYSSSDPHGLRREIISGGRIGLGSMPGQLRRICKKALERDPGNRYSSATQMVDDLRRCTTGSSTRRIMIGVAGAIVFVLGFSLPAWWPNKQPKLGGVKAGGVTAETAWLAHVVTLPAKEQVEAVSAKLVELNSGFNGEVKEAIEGGVVVGLEFLTDDVTDISPVKALIGLKTLICCGTYTTNANGKLVDLSPLKGMRLRRFSCDFNEQLSDLSPLAGMPLNYFNCARTSVADLAPLMHMPISVLVCDFTHISNLSPLMSMTLKELFCDHTSVANLAPLTGMPLEQLSCQNTAVSSLAALRGAPLKRLECHQTQVSDLTPLKGMSNLSALNIVSTKVEDLSPLEDLPSLKLLWCDFVEKRDAQLLRSLKSLEFVNNEPVATFWKEVDEAARVEANDR